jgi:hypothetical protein
MGCGRPRLRTNWAVIPRRSASGAQRAPPLQCRRHRRVRRSSGSRAQTAPQRTRAQPDHCPRQRPSARRDRAAVRRDAGDGRCRGRRALDPRRAGRRGARARHPDRTQPGAAHSAPRERALARDPQLGRQHRSGRRPKRTDIVSLDTAPPENGTILARDERGPVIPAAFPRRRVGPWMASGAKPRWNTVAGGRRSGCMARCGCAMGRS